MSPYTLDYLGRLEGWGFAAAMVQGALVLLSWIAWRRVVAPADVGRRHRLACGHFAALAILPIVTVAVLHATIAGTGTSGVADVVAPIIGAQWVWRMTVAWLSGVVAMASILAVDIGRVARLRRRAAPASLSARVHRLARTVGVAAPGVRVAALATPQIVGLWRPLLLVPHAFADQGSAHERDAVLLHELAHVRRHDFGWNLLQRALLSVLWFNPAAWTLYRHLSHEREGCCDAVAVRHGARATDLARALVRMAEDRARPGLAMAAARRSGLTARVHRLLGVDERPAATHGSRAAAGALSIASVAAIAAGGIASHDAATREAYLASAFGPTIAIEARDGSGAFGLKVRQGQVLEASVENRMLSGERIVQRGDRVVLMSDAREPIVALTVTPQGRIRWDARR